MKTLTLDSVSTAEKLRKYGSSGWADMRGILTDIRSDELPFEALEEFSNAPFEFSESVKWLWDDTQITYYHAGIENRFSENYLKLCGRLEKNIYKLGSFCLTKAVLEQKGESLPELENLTILELVKMVSFHLRKTHAAFRGMYMDNNFLGMTYLNWEFRWFELGNRLRATGVKIDKIKAGMISVDSLLQQTKKFTGVPRTNVGENSGVPSSLPLNPSALPLDRSMARNMLEKEKKAEKQAKKDAAEAVKAKQEAIRSMLARPFQPARPFGLPAPFSPLKPMDHGWEYDEPEKQEAAADPLGSVQSISHPALPQKEAVPPGCIPELEARAELMKDAMQRKDQEAILSIPKETSRELLIRWNKYLERIEVSGPPSGPPVRSGISPETRKKLREKRKKRK